jgi:outer membrane biosynthesis protein TonB
MTTRKTLACLLLLAAFGAEAHADVTSHPCMMALAQGSLEERRAQFQQALVLFEQARKEPLCEVEAQIGLARTLNSMNEHKDALAAGEWVVDHSDDSDLLAEAYYEIGRALHKPGKRMTEDKTAAEEAYRKAVEQSEGRHRGAIRALMRLYQETRQEDRLAEIQELHPDIRASTRAQQLRTVTAIKEAPAPAAEESAEALGPEPVPDAVKQQMLGPAVPGGSRDCSTRKAEAPPGSWELDLLRFCGPGTDNNTGRRPHKVSAVQPQYTEKDRKARTQGLLEFEALVDADGEVEAVRILRSLSPGLDESTRDAVCKWRLETVEHDDGQPTRFYWCGKVNYRLQ